VIFFGGKGSRSYFRRAKNSEFKPQYTTQTIKHAGRSVMVWACFFYYGVGPIHWIKAIMDQRGYHGYHGYHLLPFAECEMPLVWVFQQDNDPKNTSKKAKKRFGDNPVKAMEWPPQSPDLNPIENLLSDVKKAVAASKPASIGSLLGSN